jgi:hypothetical protein
MHDSEPGAGLATRFAAKLAFAGCFCKPADAAGRAVAGRPRPGAANEFQPAVMAAEVATHDKPLQARCFKRMIAVRTAKECSLNSRMLKLVVDSRLRASARGEIL